MARRELWELPAAALARRQNIAALARWKYRKIEEVEPERAEILLDLRRKQRVEPDIGLIRLDPKE